MSVRAKYFEIRFVFPCRTYTNLLTAIKQLNKPRRPTNLAVLKAIRNLNLGHIDKLEIKI